jgi:ABC-type transporter Mla subunit MlaD
VIQNSLDRLFAGLIQTLREVVMPATDDAFARVQLSACIEILANLATRVEWNRAQLAETTAEANAALAAAAAVATDLLGFTESQQSPEDPLASRNDALDRVSAAIRACSDLPTELRERASAPLRDFAARHVERELALLRTGMFSA